ncbi:MCP methyltransferase, CheR-type [Colwellia psychrerythraea]|uniref:Chemotaxis protein methyltransferase n=2 Tax=Colwellia psychrerythraea TaxID=28229 RepID=A0A099KCD6_COLPS|nr:protein-glutamate O-methyltransferase CheR [Colwellia psychrerythraea]KGJ87677.1 MCP methyltransferase, CheR-type [Colwellia psychrerythraea]
MTELRRSNNLQGHPQDRRVNRDQSMQLTTEDFKFICQFVYRTTGIVLNDSKREMLYRRLTRIIRERKLNSFAEYCQLLREHGEQEEDYFINAITTNLTSFFRENHHFEYLTSEELPALIKNKTVSANGKKRLRVWSSASSTGEEPYSIAITILEALKNELAQWDIKILATDIDSNVLAKGKTGIYDMNRIEEIPKKLKKSYFFQGSGKSSQSVKVHDKLKSTITFKHLNLLHDWPMKGPFDVIFCRNVIIYFDKKTQQELFSRYYEMLAPGGLLFLGHSENLGNYQQYFSNVGRTIFRKP